MRRSQSNEFRDPVAITPWFPGVASTRLLVACTNLHLPKVVYQGPAENKDMGNEIGNDQSGTHEGLISERPSACNVCLLVCRLWSV
jgi:hypothetical protein